MYYERYMLKTCLLVTDKCEFVPHDVILYVHYTSSINISQT